MTQGRRRVSRSRKQELLKTAHERDINPIRRRVRTDSYGSLGKIATALENELGDDGRIWSPVSLKHTVLGHSLFSSKLIQTGPPTIEVLQGLGSLDRSILEVKLGKIGRYGADEDNRKLGISIYSDELDEEFEAIKQRYRQVGYPLKKDLNEGNGLRVKHVTFGYLYKSASVKYDEERLQALNESIGAEGQRFNLWRLPQSFLHPDV